jgi:hypothetical protein
VWFSLNMPFLLAFVLFQVRLLNWVRFSVQGVNLDFDAISRALNLSPTHTHRAGDPGRLKNKPYPRDQWALDSPLASEEPLDTHLKWLANQLRPHYAYIKSLKSPDTDVYIFVATLLK